MPSLAAEFLSRPHGRMRTADLAHALSAAGRLLLGSGGREAAERIWSELDAVAAKSRDPTARLQAMPNAAVRALLDGPSRWPRRNSSSTPGSSQPLISNPLRRSRFTASPAFAPSTTWVRPTRYLQELWIDPW